MAAQEYMLDLEAASFKGSQFALNTKLTYKGQLRCYLRFCARMEYKPVPASDHMLVRYVVCTTKFLLLFYSALGIGGQANVRIEIY